MSGGLACAMSCRPRTPPSSGHDRLRVHDDLDPLDRDVEEEVRLDDLQPLVDQGRGVDGDHRAHGPGRVGERLLGGDVRELVAGCGPGTGRRWRSGRAGAPPAPSRRAAPGPGPSARSPPARSARARRPLHQRPADDQRLLVRQRQRRARRRARPGWGESDRARHAVEDDVARGRGELGGGVRTGEDLGQRGAPAASELLPAASRAAPARRRSRRRRPADAELGRACSASRPTSVAARGQPDDPEAVGVADYHVDGLRADGPGAAQQDDVTPVGTLIGPSSSRLVP